MNFEVPFEEPASREGEVSRQEAIEALRAIQSRGVEERERFLQFVDEQETKANAANASLANIECSIQVGRLYYEAGFKMEALEELENSRLAAYQENDAELISHIESLISDIAGDNALNIQSDE